MRVGESATLEFTVTEDDTAVALGSAAWRCWRRRGCGVVRGGHLCGGGPGAARRAHQRRHPGPAEHVAASAVSAVVRVTATVAYVDGRLVRFQVAAEQDPDARLVAHGEVTRVVVDRERFLARLSG